MHAHAEMFGFAKTGQSQLDGFTMFHPSELTGGPEGAAGIVPFEGLFF